MAAYVIVGMVLLLGWTSVHLEPIKCCLPPQFTVTLTDLATLNTDSISNLDNAVDFTINKAAMRASTFNTTTGDTVYRYRAVFDYGKGRMYYIPENSTSCFVISINSQTTRCIPDDALYLGSGYLGPFQQPGSNATITISTSSDSSCVPIIEGISDPNTNTNQTFLVTMFVPNIRNPSWFDLPSTCEQ